MKNYLYYLVKKINKQKKEIYLQVTPFRRFQLHCEILQTFASVSWFKSFMSSLFLRGQSESRMQVSSKIYPVTNQLRIKFRVLQSNEKDP